MPAPSAEPPWEDPRVALRRHGLRPKRSFSQNFLVARPTVERIADLALGAPPDTVMDAPGTVVELGPGLGTLTGALLRRQSRVVAVEPDRDMRRVLDADLVARGLPLRVVDGDATDVSFRDLPGVTAPLFVVGNLPYSVTGKILRNVTDQAGDLARATFMVQREVRDRLVAAPGTPAYGALTVFVSARFAVQPGFLVSAGAFHPRPKVASAVVVLVPLDQPRGVETDGFRRVVRAAFGQRRKTLRNALVGAGISKDPLDEALAALGLDPARRGETLSVEELAALAAALDGDTGPEP